MNHEQLLQQLEARARAGYDAMLPYHYDHVRAVIGRGGRVWFTVNNGKRLYRERALQALADIDGIEERRAKLIAEQRGAP